MKKLTKIASVAMAAVMMLSSATFATSAASKKAVDSKNTAKGVKISWKETKKAGKYKVLRSTSKKGGYKVIGKTKKTTFTDKKAKAGKTYYYTVKATKATAAYKTEKAVRLTAPKLKKVVAQETGNLVTVKWSKVKGAKNYSIYYAKVKKNGKLGKYQEYITVNDTTMDVYLEKEGTYSFKVAAVKGGSKSAFSNAKTIDFVPTPDVVLTVGETDSTIIETIDLIKAFAAMMGIENLEITAECVVADPSIVAVGDDYSIIGLAAGETTISLTLSYTLEGETYSETVELKVLVKAGEDAEPAVPDYVGEYCYYGETNVTIKINEDMTFEYITEGENFKSVVSGAYKFEVTASIEEIKMTLVPHKSVTEVNGEITTDDDMTDVAPMTAIVIGDELTLIADGTETVFFKKVEGYSGEFFLSNETDVTIKINDDMTFEYITEAENFKSVISGAYKFEVTDTIEEIKMTLVPHKSVTEVNGETTVDDDMTDVAPMTASVIGDKLTLTVDGTETVFTKVDNTTPSEPTDPSDPSEPTDPSDPSDPTPSDPVATDVVEVKGDVEVALTSEDGVVYTGSVELTDGDYSFSVYVNGEKKMFYTIGSSAEEGFDYTWGINLVEKSINIKGADAGTYTFTYDSTADTFSMAAAATPEDEPVATTTVVEVKGDVEVALTYEDDVYTGTIELADGDYTFSVYVNGEKKMFWSIGSSAEEGIDYTWGIDLVNKAIKVTGADAGTYTFTYDPVSDTFSMSAAKTPADPETPDDTNTPEIPNDSDTPVAPENPDDSNTNEDSETKPAE